jgi:hypothetical protein
MMITFIYLLLDGGVDDGGGLVVDKKFYGSALKVLVVM